MLNKITCISTKVVGQELVTIIFNTRVMDTNISHTCNTTTLWSYTLRAQVQITPILNKESYLYLHLHELMNSVVLQNKYAVDHREHDF